MRIILTLMAVMAVAAIASGAESGKVEFVKFDEAKTALTAKNPTCLYDKPDIDMDPVMCFPTIGTELKVIGKLDKEYEVEGKKGYWYVVDLGTGDAYCVFESYIEFK
jgi:hypothetical protein